ncbi:TetR/AcrR family transcriptional regulator [Nocardia flavorosea]|uniref:TetR/AcrR family transcriptional regulator n=1 Tax=Nocardia flavorosea TaxID=53429 RepID=A0A846YMW8_9NOCA|nr:TetR/AcrR family transcriptional regulator [Nocardia flavorosea]NKY58802.1 TetR/AcrR family transcriptional regulator [Nocardia flavorosea]
MAASSRRTGTETSKTRSVLLDCVEQLMLEEGYAAVTFRAVAAKAEVTPSLVQYYFRTLDGIFLAAIRRYTERNIRHLTKALDVPADQLPRALWEYSWDEATSALTTEFMALGNHRESVRAEIAEATEQVRKVQLDALATSFEGPDFLDQQLTPGALLLLITGIPKFLNLEEGIGVRTAHQELVDTFENYLDSHRATGAKSGALPSRARRRRSTPSTDR